MKVLDLFCGCGGISLGFQQAGFTIVGGVDSNPHAVATFAHNFPSASAVQADLESMTVAQMEAQIPEFSEVNVLVGGPPCQGFSSANRWTHEEEDPRNRLFFQFVEVADALQPEIIVIENVRGIVTRDNGYARDRIYSIFEERGYHVTHRVLNAAELGVPQRRFRNFFVMTRNEPFDFDSVQTSGEQVTVGDAIGELYGLESSQDQSEHVLDGAPDSPYRAYLRSGNNTLPNHGIVYPAEVVQERIAFVPQGENWRAVPEDMWPTQRSNRHSSAYRRLHEERPSVTIDTGNTHSNYFHPVFNRLPTPREAARLQSFPDDFFLSGTRSPQYIQVGNAVPPLMAKALALALREAMD